MSQPGLFGTVNPEKILILILNHWYVYVLALILAAVGGAIYLKHRIPYYDVTTTILIEEEDPIPGADLLEGFSVRPGIKNLDNQLFIVSSYSLIQEVLEQLPFEVDVFRKGLFSRVSYFPMSPVRVEPGPEGLPYGAEFVFKYAEGDQFYLSSKNKEMPDLDTMINFGQRLRYGNGSFTIYPQPELAGIYQSGERIFLKFRDFEMLANDYQERMQVDLAARDGSIVILTLRGTNRVKEIVFLNKLGEVYINKNLEKKNAEADRIIAFIDDQLVDVKESLTITENQLQEFRSENRIMNVSAQAQQIIDQAVLLENEKATLKVRKEYYDYLNDYLSKATNDEAPISPSAMGIDDPMLTIGMQELAGLQAEYFSGGVGERNPLQGQLELRIRNTKQSIKETLAGIMRGNDIAIRENEEQINKLNGEATSLPEKERQLLGFERRFNLNNVLYTYLLQARADAQIQSASNTPDNELVDSARSSDIVGPLLQIVFLIAFVLAIGLPTLVIILSNVFQNKIATEDDLIFVRDIAILGHFPHSRLSYNTVVLTEPTSVVAEAFRSLRTRLEFVTAEVACPLLVITSSMPGEGKTFSAINLASVYSLAGKKTLLVGFDLRKPTASKSFELKSEDGATSYLIGKKTLDEVIHQTDYENLDILPSGPIPPNPGELSGSSKALEMFGLLKSRYDFIIVDSAPAGVVSDIYPLAKQADVVLIMVRHNHTKKNVLSAATAELKMHGLQNLGLLLNDIRSKGGNYRYSYKYKYDYKSKPKWFDFIKRS
jgi:capsular exopolysaccharide synthesis family protein